MKRAAEAGRPAPPPDAALAPILILGIGNILLRDEGIGPHVIAHLARGSLPPRVACADGGTSGADLIEVIADREHLIVIDAADPDAGRPGDVLRVSDDDLVRNAPDTLSLHDLGLVDTLLMARHLGCYPRRVTIFAVVPAEVAPCLELSPTIEAVVPRLAEIVLAEAAPPSSPAD